MLATATALSSTTLRVASSKPETMKKPPMQYPLSAIGFVSLVMLGGFFIAPGTVFADTAHPQCDNLDTGGAGGASASFLCNASTLGENLTLYSLQVNVNANPGGTLYVGDNTTDSLGHWCQAFDASSLPSSGLGTITLATPEPFASTDRPQVVVYSNSGCTSGSTFTAVYTGTFPYVYEQFNWSPANVLTRISTVTPTGGSTVATSTSFTFGSTGYVNTSDYVSGQTYLKMTVVYPTAQINNTAFNLIGTNTCLVGFVYPFCIISWGQTEGSFANIPITSDGTFSVSTTTSLLEKGNYTVTTSVVVPTFSLFGISIGERTLTSTTTQFTAVEPTAQDNYIATVASSTNDFVNNYATSTCNVLSGSFSLGSCAYAIVVPNSNFTQSYTALITDASGKFPFSYLYSMTQTWNELSASTTLNSPDVVLNMHDLGIGSTTAFGNVLPNITVFSSSTVEHYAPTDVWSAMRALLAAVLWLGLFTNIFFTVRNLIKV